MIEIESNKHANGVSFGSSEGKFVAVFGEPEKRQVNHEGELELIYRDLIARFSKNSHEFRELTLLPNCESKINGVRVEWASCFLGTIQMLDANLVEVLGFVVSVTLGLAFTGFHDGDLSQMAIHAFTEGDWEMFKERMKPFRFEDDMSAA